MSCLGWNYLGLGNPRKVPVLRKEFRTKVPMFVFVCETKLLCRELDGISKKLGFNAAFGVDCVMAGRGRSGGLGRLWNDDQPITIKYFSLNLIGVN